MKISEPRSAFSCLGDNDIDARCGARKGGVGSAETSARHRVIRWAAKCPGQSQTIYAVGI